MSFEFAWDTKKAKANLKKHRGVSFEEGMTVFADPLAKIFTDEEHSFDERRDYHWTFNETEADSGFFYKRRHQSTNN